MNDKIRAKIDSMSEKHSRVHDEGEEALNAKVDYTMGAKPWAEWCERFERVLDDAVSGSIGSVSDNAKAWMQKELKEYHQWIEDVDG